MMMKSNIASYTCPEKAKAIINRSDIDHVFESIYSMIISNIQ